MTIDRVDNTRGYIVENMVKACWICNKTKGDIITSKQAKLIMPEIMAELRQELNEARKTLN